MLNEEIKQLTMSMGKIIYCSDLVLRVDEAEDVTNITEWLMESTEYRPLNPDGCVVRHEVTTVVSSMCIVRSGVVRVGVRVVGLCIKKVPPPTPGRPQD
jgi:hypothetical protein